MVDTNTEYEFRRRLDDAINLVNSFFLKELITEEQFDFLTYSLVNLRSSFEHSKEIILMEYFNSNNFFLKERCMDDIFVIEKNR